MGMDASLLTGASVRLAAQSEDEGGGGGSGDAPVIGKFSGAVIAGEGPSSGFLADPGGDIALGASAQTDPQLYPTAARTFTTMRVTAVGGGDPSLPITVTLYKNGAATAQHVVIPAGTAAGTVIVDSSHPIAFTANQKFDVFTSTTGSISGSLAVSVTLEGPAGGGGGGGGGGSINLITSNDGSIAVVDPSGPTVDLSVAGALDWWDERQRRAEFLLNSSGVIQVDTPFRFNYAEMTPAALGIGYGILANRSGTWALLNLGGDSGLIDGPVSSAALLASIQAGAGATAGGLTTVNTHIASPPTEPWFISKLVSEGALVASGFVIPIGLRNPGDAGSYVKIIQIAGNSHFFLQLADGGGVTTIDLGPTCALGSALAPLGPPFWIDVWFDLLAGSLSVAFQDTTVLTVPGVGGGLNGLPAAAMQLYAESDGNAPSVNLATGGGFVMIRRPLA